MKAMSQAPMLQIDHLSAGYGRAVVIPDLSITANNGSVVTVIGPNGAGKSTLLNAIMGVLPSKGSIQFKGKNIVLNKLEERVSLGMSLVPEKRELFTTMTVEDNLTLGGYANMRRGDKEWLDTINTVFELFPRLKERRTQAAGTLSGGERQMLAIGRAMMAKPDLLMLDEPSLGLAPLVVKEIFRIIQELRKTGVTILLVEQNARAALEIADYGYVLETGAVALENEASSLATDPRVIETYLGSSKK
jgi:branched-chain amino acid transport system ATP-binding protein